MIAKPNSVTAKLFPGLISGLAAFLAGMLLLLPGTALAQSDMTASEQLELLRGLPPDQREAIIKSLQDGDQIDQGLEFPDTATRVPSRDFLEIDDEEKEPRIEAGDTLVVDFSFTEYEDADAFEVEAEIEAALENANVAALVGDNTYVLNDAGQLVLRGFGGIYLVGLTTDEAAIRIASEPFLDIFDVTVTLLPLQPQGTKSLTLFGYDLFTKVPSTFAPATDIPVPADYVIGPGDTFEVQLFGSENRQYSLVVNRDGVVNFPEIGPLHVGGMTFSGAREELQERVKQQLIGVTASIAMGELRSIRIFVLGDAVTPGSFTIGGLSTITNALFASGGVSEIGSLRDIQLKRKGKLIQTLDFYDLLLGGDTSNDVRLKPGDVIFIPPAGRRVGMAGEFRRPAIYELAGEKTVAQVVALAGGILPSADPDVAKLDRILAGQERVVLNVNLSSQSGLRMAVRDGDTLTVEPVLSQQQDVVFLTGHVFRPGQYQWYKGMRVSKLLPDRELLQPKADTRYLMIRRELTTENKIVVLSADLELAWAESGSADDVILQPRDNVYVFDLEAGRSQFVDPILDELSLQSIKGEPTRVVRIGGLVRAPGRYPLEPDMRISDLLRAGGGLGESAYILESELTRYSIVNGRYRIAELLPIGLAVLLEGDETKDITLKPYDYLSIKEISRWGDQEEVMVEGEVRFPGVYQIRQAETLSSVIQRAGGLSELAFAEGSIFTREKLQTKEQEQLDALSRRLELDLAAVTLTRVQESPQAAQGLALGQSLVEQLRGARAVGRLVIDLESIVSNPGDPTVDIVLQDGDRLIVPEQTQEVTVIGEVQYATSHIYNPGFKRDDYVNSSGGITQKADKKRIYVVRANGAVMATPTSRWFKDTTAGTIRPGDTIVVPLDADRVSKLTLVSNVSAIIFQLGVLAAAATN